MILYAFTTLIAVVALQRGPERKVKMLAAVQARYVGMYWPGLVLGRHGKKDKASEDVLEEKLTGLAVEQNKSGERKGGMKSNSQALDFSWVAGDGPV